MIAEEWVSLIGYRSATRLFLSYGGKNLHIPKYPKKEHQIALMIGFDALCKLSDAYPSELLFVPRMNDFIAEMRKHIASIDSRSDMHVKKLTRPAAHQVRLFE